MASNVFPNSGLAIVTNLLTGHGTPPEYIGWGTGAGIASTSDGALFTEAMSTHNDGSGHNTRPAGSLSQQTITENNDTFQVVGTLTADIMRTITNAGLFDANGQATDLVTAPSGGNMFEKGSFPNIVLGEGDSITFTFKVQMTS